MAHSVSQPIKTSRTTLINYAREMIRTKKWHSAKAHFFHAWTIVFVCLFFVCEGFLSLGRRFSRVANWKEKKTENVNCWNLYFLSYRNGRPLFRTDFSSWFQISHLFLCADTIFVNLDQKIILYCWYYNIDINVNQRSFDPLLSRFKTIVDVHF